MYIAILSAIALSYLCLRFSKYKVRDLACPSCKTKTSDLERAEAVLRENTTAMSSTVVEVTLYVHIYIYIYTLFARCRGYDVVEPVGSLKET